MSQQNGQAAQTAPQQQQPSELQQAMSERFKISEQHTILTLQLEDLDAQRAKIVTQLAAAKGNFQGISIQINQYLEQQRQQEQAQQQGQQQGQPQQNSQGAEAPPPGTGPVEKPEKAESAPSNVTPIKKKK
jgi:hypothetical protein